MPIRIVVANCNCDSLRFESVVTQRNAISAILYTFKRYLRQRKYEIKSKKNQMILSSAWKMNKILKSTEVKYFEYEQLLN